MSDREDEPTDLFDAICRLDDLIAWLKDDYPAEAEQIARAADTLRGDIVISLKAEG